jgi:hypothetical protein
VFFTHQLRPCTVLAADPLVDSVPVNSHFRRQLCHSFSVTPPLHRHLPLGWPNKHMLFSPHLISLNETAQNCTIVFICAHLWLTW